MNNHHKLFISCLEDDKLSTTFSESSSVSISSKLNYELIQKQLKVIELHPATCTSEIGSNHSVLANTKLHVSSLIHILIPALLVFFEIDTSMLHLNLPTLCLDRLVLHICLCVTHVELLTNMTSF